MSTKINMLVPIRYPVGGIRTYLKYTYGKLDRDRYRFILIGPQGDWLQFIRNDLSNHSVEIICTDSKYDNPSLLWSIMSALRKGGLDLIHSQGYTAGVLSNLANAAFGLPHVITLHRTFGSDHTTSSFWDNYALIKKSMLTLILKKADVIQSVSRDAQANLLEYFPNLANTPDKLKIIRNGIDIHEFDEDAGPGNAAFTKEPGMFSIGYFGRYMPEKGFDCLIDMVDILVNRYGIRNFRVPCVGGPGEFFLVYKRDIRTRGLDDYFQFLDFFPNIAPVMKLMDILVIPSLGEACGLISMEGLVCGVPTVAFSCIGLREVLEGTPARMVPVGDSWGLAEQVSGIMNDYPAAKQTFADFVPEARQMFDSAHTAGQLESLIETLIGRSRPVADRHSAKSFPPSLLSFPRRREPGGS
ncbi:MAG TPA: glycosyltransferase family 4 protein [Deltaproteobacteria bacterium]|nr:glycosyltransferase family 4 protein [Deltaproteobacteria bacterium]